MKLALRVWLAAGALAMATGCVTVPEFQAVRRDVDALKKGGGGGGSPSARLADMGAEINSLHEEVANLRGEIEEARHLAEKAMQEARDARERSSRAGAGAGSSSTGSPSSGRTSPPPSGASGGLTGGGGAAEPLVAASAEVRDYELAFRSYRAGDHRAAIDRFQAFLQTHPSSEYADNALFWMGESHFKLGDFEQAAVTFDQVVKEYPAGNKVPDALYRQGIALLEIGRKTGQSDSYTPAARQIFERIVRDHSSSERVSEARRQLEILRQ